MIWIYVISGLLILWTIFHHIQLAREKKRYPMPGKISTINGFEQHFFHSGTGNITVIFENGAGFGVGFWGPILAEVAKHAQVFAYDRPNVGWSGAVEKDPTGEDVADNLKRLIDEQGINGPLLLVGMSVGGIYVRHFYKKYPEQVTGMVLVDSSHERMGPDMEAAGWKMRSENLLAFRILKYMNLLSPFGFFRFVLLFKAEFDAPLKALLVRPNGFKNFVVDAARWIHECYREQSPPDLGDLPLTVVSQGNIKKTIKGQSRGMKKAYPKVWPQHQQELLSLSTNSTSIIAEQSSHVIQLDQPDVAIKAIVDMVKQLKS